MKFWLLRTLGALALAALVSAPVAAQETSGLQEAPVLRIDLNIPSNRLVVYEGDRVVKSYGVSVGKPGYDTPVGDYTLDHAEWNPWWRPPPGREWTRGREITPPGPNNPMGRVKLFFAPLYFIHGTTEAESIGAPASHGCVRMTNKDVIELARLVHERAAPGVTPREIDRILAQPRNTRTVRFQKPVEVVIRYEPIVVENGELRIYPDIYRYNRIHGEGVVQALMGAGYSVDGLDRKAVNELLARAARQKGTFRISVVEAFPNATLAAS
jgi:murein L,D-transpeptidase YcbB/YkuD